MRMTIGIAFILISLVYSVGLNILYFTKKHVKNYETRLFSIFLPANLFGLILELCCSLLVVFLGTKNILSILVVKLFLIYLIMFVLLLLLYVYVICRNSETVIELNSNQKKIRNIFIVIFVVLSFIDFVLPIEIKESNGAAFSGGLATSFVYIISAVSSLYCILIFVLNINILKRKKNIPLVVYIVGTGLLAILQQRFPEFTIATSVETFVIFLMYNTIENPDVKMVQQLEIAKDAADRANNSKTEFLSSMSHEIRTPLNAIVGFSDCIMDATSVEEAKENAKDIVNASQTLLEIVNGILDISKIEAGKMEIVNVKYDPTEVFTELATLITPRMKEKGLDFTYSIDSSLPATLFGDKANIKKIVTNFLSNACKYTDHGFVRYEVHCVKLGEYCRLIISVEDSGRGIKKDSVDKLFTRFQRLDEDRNTTIEGTGLGLAITKQLTELMGGKVLVHTVYGEGSKFTAVINQKIDSMVGTVTPKQYTNLNLSGVRILVVDDAQLNLKVTDKLFKKYGADSVDLCSSGFECLERIKNGDEYDLLFLDDMMPRMNGTETFHKLKENPNFKIPTIALTANAITGMREKYLAEGFNDYLAKPIEQNELIRVCNVLLGRSGNTGMMPAVKEETAPKKNSDIIPVEENIEEIIGESTPVENKFESVIAKQENVEQLDDDVAATKVTPSTGTKEEDLEPVVNLIPVVDIHFGSTEPPKEEEAEPIEEVLEDVSEEVLEADEEEPHETHTSEEEVYDRAYLEKNGADINHALELLGDMEMYNATIQDFLSEVEEKWQRLIDYKDSGDMKNYAIDVHSLKSDCKYLGFMTLADIAYQHELKSKDNDLDYVREHFSELEEEYKKTLEIAKNYSSANPAEE